MQLLRLAACVFIHLGVYLITRMLRRHNELPPAELTTPQAYIELPENQRFLTAFSRFYTHFGPSSSRKIERHINGRPIEFPTFIAGLMTHTSDRSMLLLRASQAEFDEITYRLFTYTFENTHENPDGAAAEYKLITERFGLTDTDYTFQSRRYIELEFAKVGEHTGPILPINDQALRLTLGENDEFPNRLTTNGNRALHLTHAHVDIQKIDYRDPAISVGQLALQQVTAA